MYLSLTCVLVKHIAPDSAKYSCKSHKNADFSGGNYASRDFSGAQFDGANFAGANLRNVNFMGASVKGCDFSGSDLRGIRAQYLKAQGAKFDASTKIDDESNFAHASGVPEFILNQASKPFSGY